MASVTAELDNDRGVLAPLRRLLSSQRFEYFIISLIVINAITLGLETSKVAMGAFGEQLRFVDGMIISIFVTELLLRMLAFGSRFWRDPWSLFDTAVVGVALLPSGGNFAVMRALRILRVLRLISAFPRMRRVVMGLIDAIPSMWTVIVLLLLIFYIFSVMATKLFGPTFEEWFGTIGASAYTLFQIMTLEGWSDGIVRPVMKEFPWAWLFFVPFILITSFAVLNLFIGIIVDAMQTEHTETREEVHEAERQTESEIGELLSEVRALRAEVAELRSASAAQTDLAP